MKTVDEILDELKQWQMALQKAQFVIENVGLSPDGSLFIALDDLMHLATENAARIIGCHIEWLAAWWLEYEFGKKPMMVKFKGSDEEHTAKTLAELAALIHKDMQHATAS